MCIWCGKEVGYTIGTADGKTGHYYFLRCKKCCCTLCSEIMRVCNDNNGRERNTEESFDRHYYVYSEAYIRRVIKEG